MIRGDFTDPVRTTDPAATALGITTPTTFTGHAVQRLTPSAPPSPEVPPARMRTPLTAWPPRSRD